MHMEQQSIVCYHKYTFLQHFTTYILRLWRIIQTAISKLKFAREDFIQ